MYALRHLIAGVPYMYRGLESLAMARSLADRISHEGDCYPVILRWSFDLKTYIPLGEIA